MKAGYHIASRFLPVLITLFFFSAPLSAQVECQGIHPEIFPEEIHQCLADTGDTGGGEADKCFKICAGDTACYRTLDIPGLSYQWTLNGGGNIISGNTSSQVCVEWTTAGTYELYVLVTCQEKKYRDTLCIEVLPGVTAAMGSTPAAVGGVITICNNATVTFLNNSFSGIVLSSWDFGDGNFTVTPGTASVTNMYTTPGTYTVTLTAQSECCQDTAQITVVVDSLSGPDIFCVTPVCGETTGVMYCTSANCTSYDWNVTGAVSFTGDGTSCITVDWGPGPNGDISLQVLNCTPSFCPQPTVVTVPIMPSGGFTIAGPGVVCLNATETYTAPNVPGTQYTWTLVDPSSFTQILPYSVPPYQQGISFTQPGTYTLICHMQNDVLDCEGDDTITIQVVDDFSISGNDTLCVNGMELFSATQNFLPFNCNWVVTDSANNTVFTQNGIDNISFLFTIPGTYTVTATEAVSGSACVSTHVHTVVVLPGPAQPLISPNPLVCPNTPYTYAASGNPPGTSYQWTVFDGSNTFFYNSNPITHTWPSGFVTGTVSVTPLQGGCPGTPAAITVNGYSTPAPSPSGDLSVCPDEQIPYSTVLSYPGSSVINWTVTPSNAGTIISGQGTTNPVIEWHLQNPSGTYSATVTVSETICGNLTGTGSISITIHPLPAPVATGNNICPGGTLTLNATGGGGSTFEWFTSSAVSLGTGSTMVVFSAGNYYVEETDLNGCKAKDFIQVNAFTAPVASISTQDVAVCDTNGVLLNTLDLETFNGSGYSFLWMPGSGTTNPFTVAATGTYSVTVTDLNGCTATDFFTVLCNPADTCELPVCTCVNNPPTAVQNFPNCSQFTFTANSTCTGIPSWSFGDGFFGSGSPVTHNYLQAGNYIVVYGATDTGCCPPSPNYIAVTVPVAANFSYVTTCNSVSFTDLSTVLPSDTITGYSWNFGDFGTSSLQNPTHVYASGGSFPVTLTVTTTSGCQVSVTINVIVNGPGISATIQSTGCNQQIQFGATQTGGSLPVVSWLWDFGDGTTGSTVQNPQHLYTVGSPTTFTVIVTATDGAGCIMSDTGTITIMPPPSSFNLLYTSPGCGSVSISTPATYVTYQWFMNGTALSGETNATYTATASGNYYVEVTDANGCLIQSNIASIVVNPLPPLFVSVNPLPACSNQTITVSSGLGSGFSVQWFDLSNVFVAAGAALTLTNPAPGSYGYICIATDLSTNCVATDTLQFTVNPAPFVFITNNFPSGVCAGNPVTLTANPYPAVIGYSWSNGDFTPVTIVNTSGSYSVTVTDGVGCTASATTLVTIFPLPDLSMLPIGCDSACITPVADTIHGPPGMALYDWQINGLPVSSNQQLILNTLNLPVFNVPYTIQLIATSADGCTDSTDFQYTPKDCDTAGCYTVTDTIWCNLDGSWSFQIKVQNNNATSSASILLDNFTLPLAVNGLPYFYDFMYLPPGGNSGWFPSIPLILSNPTSLPTPPSFCFNTMVVYGDTCCYDSVCIEIPDCDPCENISVSTVQDSSGCCQQINIANNFLPGYFSGVQVIPVTTGTSIASSSLGGGGAGWSASGTSAIMSFYPPSGGFIPVGTINDLFTLCLNLQMGTPTPQLVAFNWFVPGANGTDSVVCSDTLVFDCDPPQENPCGTVEDTIVCIGNGTYLYTFTITNNTPNPIQTAVIDYLNPNTGLTMPIIFFFTPSILPDSSATQTATITTNLPAGTEICYHMALLDSIGCCCHAMDTVCFTLPPCDTLCACGEWESFDMDVVSGGNTTNYTAAECGAVFTGLEAGAFVGFASGGFTCAGDSSCASTVTWSVPGATPSSGSGLPAFTMNSPGTYVLTLYGSCGSNQCDSCQMTFVVDSCQCGDWELFDYTAVWDENGSMSEANYHDQHCGSVYQNINPFAAITFNSGGFLCSGSDCPADLLWELNGTNGTSLTGTGLPVFSLAGTGTYTLTLYGYCNGILCDSCQFIWVTSGELCSCGEWDPFTVTTSSVSYINQLCGSTYTSQPGFPIIVNGTYHCDGDATCSAGYQWTVTYGVNIISGTGMPVAFTPPAGGTYYVSILPLCNGVDCEGCEFKFKVKQPLGGLIPEFESPSEPMANHLRTQPVSIQVAPNPAKERLSVSIYLNGEEDGNLYMLNELGMVVDQMPVQLRKGLNTMEWNVEALAAGSYTVRFNGKHSSAFTRFVVTR